MHRVIVMLLVLSLISAACGGQAMPDRSNGGARASGAGEAKAGDTPMEFAELARSRDLPGPINSIDWSPDGRTVVAGSYGEVELLTPDLAVRQRVDADFGQVWGVAWSPSDDSFAIASSGRGIEVRGNDRVKATRQPSDTGAMSVAWTADARELLAGYEDGRVTVTTVADDGSPRTLRRDGPPVIAVAASPDGRWVAAGDLSGAVHVWSTDEWAEVAVLSEAEGRNDANGVAWSGDSQRLAVAHQSGEVDLWRAHSWELERSLLAHRGWARGVAFSPSGEELATTGSDGAVKVWGLATGTLVGEANGHVSAAWSVAWSPDGLRLATGSGVYRATSGDRTVRVWDATTIR